MATGLMERCLLNRMQHWQADLNQALLHLARGTNSERVACDIVAMVQVFLASGDTIAAGQLVDRYLKLRGK